MGSSSVESRHYAYSPNRRRVIRAVIAVAALKLTLLAGCVANGAAQGSEPASSPRPTAPSVVRTSPKPLSNIDLLNGSFMSETDPNHLCLTDTRFDLKPSPEAINRGMLPARLMRGYNWPGQELLMVTPAAVELDNRGYAPDDSYISFHISKSGVLGVLDEGSRRLLTDEFGCVNIEIVGE